VAGFRFAFGMVKATRHEEIKLYVNYFTRLPTLFHAKKRKERKQIFSRYLNVFNRSIMKVLPTVPG